LITRGENEDDLDEAIERLCKESILGIDLEYH
jgi:hypothetical protein